MPGGRGAGYGGPAKGEGNKVPFSAGDQYRGRRTSEAIAAKIANREEVLEFYTEVIRDGGEATINRISAGDKLLDRIEGKAVQKNVNALTGPNGEPLAFTWGDGTS
jgi:hypothetical protein